MRIQICISTLVPFLALPMGVGAHHSRANFELDRVIELQGTVMEYAWNNPHTYVTMNVPNEAGEIEEWLLELNSIAVLTRTGWNRETLKVGDEVIVRGNRDRDHGKRFFFANVFVMPNGTELVSAPSVAGTVAGNRTPPQQMAAVTDARSEDFSGIWRSGGGGPGAGAGSGGAGPGGAGPGGAGPGGAGGGAGPGGGRNLLTGAIFEASRLPVTPKGQAAVDNYNEDDNPAFECLPGTPPSLGRGVLEIVRESDDSILFRYELMDVERRVHLGMAEHPMDTERTHLGHSIAWFEGDTLVVDTTYFAYNRWGNGRGIPSGDLKHAVERYTIIDGGRRMRVETLQEDPEYLAEPVRRTSMFTFAPDYEWQDYNCDPLATRRHLDP